MKRTSVVRLRNGGRDGTWTEPDAYRVYPAKPGAPVPGYHFRATWHCATVFHLTQPKVSDLVRPRNSLRRELVHQAEHEGVNLNQFITAALTSAVHWRKPTVHAERIRSWRAVTMIADVQSLPLASPDQTPYC